MEKSTDKATLSMVAQAEKQGIAVVWDRFDRQLPQCGFGESGLCCRNCLQGPCRIDPFGEGPQQGVCGASADTMVARGLARAVAAGTASHGGHAKHIAHTLLKSARGEVLDYPIRDEGKLRAVAERIGLDNGAASVGEMAAAIAKKALEEFSEKDTPLAWAATSVTSGRIDALSKSK